eukprot:scaffold18928_cov69-Phaeocystis_antarctica.AAC.3
MRNSCAQREFRPVARVPQFQEACASLELRQHLVVPEDLQPFDAPGERLRRLSKRRDVPSRPRWGVASPSAALHHGFDGAEVLFGPAVPPIVPLPFVRGTLVVPEQGIRVGILREDWPATEDRLLLDFVIAHVHSHHVHHPRSLEMLHIFSA